MTAQAHIDALKRERAGPLSAWGTPERDLTWRALRRQWHKLTWVMAMAFTSSGLELLRMGLLLAFLGSAPFRIAQWIPRVALETGPLLTALVCVSVAAAGLDWWRRHVALLVQRDFTERLRADVCLAMLHRPLDWFTANPAGHASYLLNGQVGRFSTLVPMASDGVAAILQGLAVIALMLWMSVPLTVLALTGSAILWLSVHPLQRRIRTLSVEVSVESGKTAAKAEECAYAIKLIKSCRTEAFERDRYAVMARALAEKQVRLSDLRNAAGGITLIGFVGILVGAVWAAPNGTILAGFGVLLLRLYPCLTKLLEARTALATMSGHLAAVAEFLDSPTPPGAPNWQGRDGLSTDRIPHGGISTRALDAFYTPDKPVLDGITLQIPRGQATALVGLTGSGKTTLLDILAGIRPSQRGAVATPNPIGYVTQEPIVLAGTLAENGLYGAFRKASDTVLGKTASNIGMRLGDSLASRGANLSGGQRQLVALGRVVWQGPDVYLLDEPTSAMDAEIEDLSMDIILGMARTAIVLMATHKLSLAARFDRILVLHHGKIVQDGTHEELVKEDGLYQRLWKLQEIT